MDMLHDPPPDKARRRSAPVDLPEEAVPVFEQLRVWLAAAAKEQGVPAYVIFHDATLRQIAAELPTTLAELGTVNGVGEHKLAKYGQQILNTLVPRTMIRTVAGGAEKSDGEAEGS